MKITGQILFSSVPKIDYNLLAVDEKKAGLIKK